jgi:L-serine dehydratase
MLAHCKNNGLSLAQVAMANEMSVSGRSQAEVNAYLDKILGAMRATVKTGLEAPTSTLLGPIKLKTKAHDVYVSASKQEGVARKAIGLVSAYALAGSEENARGHLVLAADRGSAGVIPGAVYSLGRRRQPRTDPPAPGWRRRWLSVQAQRDALGCRGCRGRDRSRSAMGAAVIAQAYGGPRRSRRTAPRLAGAPSWDLRSGRGFPW